MSFRPVPGKFCFDLVHNAIVRVKAYKTDSSGEHIIVRLAGSYGDTAAALVHSPPDQ